MAEVAYGDVAPALVGVFADVEAVMIGLLKPLLLARNENCVQGVWVSNVMPKKADGTPTRHPCMVIIRDDSGTQLDLVRESVSVGIQFWAQSREDAKDLAEICRSLINGLGGQGPIKRIRCTLRPMFIEDAQPMYYAAFTGIWRGV